MNLHPIMHSLRMCKHAPKLREKSYSKPLQTWDSTHTVLEVSSMLHHVFVYEPVAENKAPCDSVQHDYAKAVHELHMDVVGLPRDTRNWEQIEAADEEKHFEAFHDPTVGCSRAEGVYRRTIFALEDKHVIKVIDLVCK